MLSPLVSEIIAPPLNVFFCDCKPECVDSCKLPVLIVDMLMNDVTLMLLVGGHKSDKAGEKIESGKGWKVCRVK